MFEGSAETMLRSLDLICELPDDTLLWPGLWYFTYYVVRNAMSFIRILSSLTELLLIILLLNIYLHKHKLMCLYMYISVYVYDLNL